MVFPSAAFVCKGKRRPHPQTAARHRAKLMLPVPRHSLLRVHPFATSALHRAPARPGPWASGQSTHVGLRMAQRRQEQGGASRPPRPPRAPPPAGSGDPRQARALARPKARVSGFAACACACACAWWGFGWGWDAVKAAEAASSSGKAACRGRLRWRRGRFPGKGRKWVSRAAIRPLWRLEWEITRYCSRFSHFMVKSK